MKRVLCLIAALLLLCSSAYAAESFQTGWTEYIETGDPIVFDPAGTTLHISAAGPVTSTSS